MPHLAAVVQNLKGFCHFLRLKQIIRAVQQQQIETFHTQSPQRTLHSCDHIVFGKIVASRIAGVGLAGFADAAFAGQNELVSQSRAVAQHFAEQRFALAAAINIGMIEMVVACLNRGVNRTLAFGAAGNRVVADQAHAAINNAR